MFGYGVDRRVIYGVLGALILYSLLSMSQTEWLSILLTLPAVIIAITFHEFAHAFAAVKFGDNTPRNQGRLNLNPLSHLDPFGFVLLMFAHIGWGKPVQINPNNFNTNKSLGFCESMVALAGPLMNFLIAIISSIAYLLIAYFNPSIYYSSYNGYFLNMFLTMLITINIGLGVFNLIPLPPLDGEKIFRNLLPYNARVWLERNYQTLTMVFMILWIFGILEIIVAPVISFITKGMLTVISKIIRILL